MLKGAGIRLKRDFGVIIDSEDIFKPKQQLAVKRRWHERGRTTADKDGTDRAACEQRRLSTCVADQLINIGGIVRRCGGFVRVKVTVRTLFDTPGHVHV